MNLHLFTMKHKSFTFIIILIISMITGFLGIFLQNNFAPWISMLLFLIYSAGYFIFAYTYKNKNFQKISNV